MGRIERLADALYEEIDLSVEEALDFARALVARGVTLGPTIPEEPSEKAVKAAWKAYELNPGIDWDMEPILHAAYAAEREAQKGV